jgi:hypothetical protein
MVESIALPSSALSTEHPNDTKGEEEQERTSNHSNLHVTIDQTPTLNTDNDLCNSRATRSQAPSLAPNLQ